MYPQYNTKRWTSMTGGDGYDNHNTCFKKSEKLKKLRDSRRQAVRHYIGRSQGFAQAGDIETKKENDRPLEIR